MTKGVTEPSAKYETQSVKDEEAFGRLSRGFLSVVSAAQAVESMFE